MTATASFSIVIPVFNKVHLTERCLDSFLRHSKAKHQIIVIDNASKDDTFQKLQVWKEKFLQAGWDFQAVKNEVNVGFGRAMNQGAQLAKHESLALVNNDTWLVPDWDLHFQQAMERNPDVSLFCPHVDESKPFDETRLLKKASQFQLKNKRRQKKAFTAVFMVFRKQDFFKIGQFDESFFVSYEDTDLRERMDREHYTYLTVGSCFVWHQSMATRASSTELPSDYELQGKAIFMKKWGFDPSLREKTSQARWKRRWSRILSRLGYL